MTVEEFESLGVGDVIRGSYVGLYEITERRNVGVYKIRCLRDGKVGNATIPKFWTLVKRVSVPDIINPKSGFTRTGRLAP